MCGLFSLLTNIMSFCGIYILWNVNSDLETRVEKLEKIVLEQSKDKTNF